MGVWAPHKVTIDLRRMIGDFLKTLNLELSYEKTKITNTRRSRAKFLSTYINRFASSRDMRKRTNELGRRVRISTNHL